MVKLFIYLFIINFYRYFIFDYVKKKGGGCDLKIFF